VGQPGGAVSAEDRNSKSAAPFCAVLLEEVVRANTLSRIVRRLWSRRRMPRSLDQEPWFKTTLTAPSARPSAWGRPCRELSFDWHHL